MECSKAEWSLFTVSQEYGTTVDTLKLLHKWMIDCEINVSSKMVANSNENLEELLFTLPIVMVAGLVLFQVPKI